MKRPACPEIAGRRNRQAGRLQRRAQRRPQLRLGHLSADGGLHRRSALAGLRVLGYDVEFLSSTSAKLIPEPPAPHHSMTTSGAAPAACASRSRSSSPFSSTSWRRCPSQIRGPTHASFLIDKSGRIAYRRWPATPLARRRPRRALERQKEDGHEHAIVHAERTIAPRLRPSSTPTAIERGGYDR